MSSRSMLSVEAVAVIAVAIVGAVIYIGRSSTSETTAVNWHAQSGRTGGVAEAAVARNTAQPCFPGG